MNGIIGFMLLFSTLTFFIVFLMGDSLTTKEKIKLALEIIFILSSMTIGSYFLEPYIN